MNYYKIYFEGYINQTGESEDEATQEVYDRLNKIATIKITDVEEN